MFDLEKAIANWRKQMLAAGIKMPAPLEELEIHLREEIEQQREHHENDDHGEPAAGPVPPVQRDRLRARIGAGHQNDVQLRTSSRPLLPCHDPRRC